MIFINHLHIELFLGAVGAQECLVSVGALDLQKAVGGVSDAARQDLVVQHGIYHCALTITRPMENQFTMFNLRIATPQA